MFRIENLTVEVDNRKIIDKLNLCIPDGEIHAIMGPNGAGKSTILKTIMGDKNYKITKGKIVYNDEVITNLSVDEIAKKGIFFLMQNPTEIPGVTNAEMLRVALGDRDIKETIFDFNKRLNAAALKLDIDKSFLHRSINEFMSGGEKKKNELLQIEILCPSLILLDEVDSGLDVDSLKHISMRLNDYVSEKNASILLITHHTNILEYLKPDKVYILAEGNIVQEGDLNLARKIEKSGYKGAFSVSEE